MRYRCGSHKINNVLLWGETGHHVINLEHSEGSGGKLSGNRIIYQDWIVGIGHEPGSEYQSQLFVSLDSPTAGRLTNEDVPSVSGEKKRSILVRRKVAEAMKQLSDDEREFIARFYFMGESYRRISKMSGRAVYKLEALHGRSIRKLRRYLASFVENTYGLRTDRRKECLICSSPFLHEIDRLIANRDRTETWKPIIRTLRAKYGLRVVSPQLLIGHEKYH